MTKLKQKKKSPKIKLQNISDYVLLQENTNDCQFFIVNDGDEYPSLIMVFKKFETEDQIYDFIENMKITNDTEAINRSYH